MTKHKKYFILVAILILTVSVALYYLSKSTTFQFFGEIFPKITTEQKVLALTFDDGPTKKVDTILNILNAHNIKATFFVNGNQIENHFAETQKLVSAGHELGNHSYSHKRMIFKSYSFIKEEIEKTDSLIRKSGYSNIIHFRPPYGKKLFALPYYLKTKNRKTIMWDVEPESNPHTAKSSDKIAEFVLDNSSSGSIILLHGMFESRKESVKSINKIIEGLKKKGFEFKTISELLKYEKSKPD